MNLGPKPSCVQIAFPRACQLEFIELGRVSLRKFMLDMSLSRFSEKAALVCPQILTMRVLIFK